MTTNNGNSRALRIARDYVPNGKGGEEQVTVGVCIRHGYDVALHLDATAARHAVDALGRLDDMVGASEASASARTVLSALARAWRVAHRDLGQAPARKGADARVTDDKGKQVPMPTYAPTGGHASVEPALVGIDDDALRGIARDALARDDQRAVAIAHRISAPTHDAWIQRWGNARANGEEWATHIDPIATGRSGALHELQTGERIS